MNYPAPPRRVPGPPLVGDENKKRTLSLPSPHLFGGPLYLSGSGEFLHPLRREGLILTLPFLFVGRHLARAGDGFGWASVTAGLGHVVLVVHIQVLWVLLC